MSDATVSMKLNAAEMKLLALGCQKAIVTARTKEERAALNRLWRRIYAHWDILHRSPTE